MRTLLIASALLLTGCHAKKVKVDCNAFADHLEKVAKAAIGRLDGEARVKAEERFAAVAVDEKAKALAGCNETGEDDPDHFGCVLRAETPEAIRDCR